MDAAAERRTSLEALTVLLTKTQALRGVGAGSEFVAQIKWDVDEKGGIQVCPLMRWSTGQAFDSLCILRLEYATSPEEFKSGERALQLVLTPKQAFDLAADLKRSAENLMKPSDKVPQ